MGGPKEMVWSIIGITALAGMGGTGMGGLISCLFRWKQGAVRFRAIFPAVLAGCAAAAAFSFLGVRMDLALLKKLFGGLLIATGIRELTYRPK